MFFVPLVINPFGWETLVIILAILLLFGGRKIPEMMRGMGTGIREFKKGLKDGEGEKETEDRSASDEKNNQS